MAKIRPDDSAAVHARESRRLSTLLDVSQALSGTLNLRSALHRVLEVLAKHHGTVRSMVTLLQDNGELHVEASDGLDQSPHTIRYRLGEGIIGKVVQSSKPIVVPRVSREPAFLQPCRKAPGTAEGRAQLHLRADPAQPPCRRRAGRRPQVQGRPQLRPQRPFYGIVASAIAQAVKIQRLIEEDKKKLVDENTQLRQELKERYPYFEHHRQQRPGASDVRADVAGGGHEHHGAASAANRAPARKWWPTPSITTPRAPTNRSSR